MDFYQFFGKYIRVTFIDGEVMEGFCNTYNTKYDTEDELYDELTIENAKYAYFGFDESEVSKIEEIEKFDW
ncbi:hypothetical protein EF384_07350 [Aerococcus agrisoli]|uniref:FERM domain-containing protein n=1 Tax=Aerococcus agrisoli TaxID=2487350 RepID=A0A3N4GZP0_9LACT|nr:hypothetical protein [Aerococcus agrisoli]RPA58454.1 hypothetical protein EF384_07350 [Aerococcus agrisoli]